MGHPVPCFKISFKILYEAIHITSLACSAFYDLSRLLMTQCKTVLLSKMFYDMILFPNQTVLFRNKQKVLIHSFVLFHFDKCLSGKFWYYTEMYVLKAIPAFNIIQNAPC